MNEQLLQYLWRYNLYNPAKLATYQGDEVIVLHPGTLNTNAGPDFLEAKIKIGNTLWVGNVEIHVHSSDWIKHKHQGDKKYDNLILHVVYENDTQNLQLSCPELCLKNHINIHTLKRYKELMLAEQPIACAHQIHNVPNIIFQNWLERLLTERWTHKLEEWQALWQQSSSDWRQLLYLRLGANFGLHINRDAFLELVKSIPLKVLYKHSNNLLQLEALLFGQSGLLPEHPKDGYSKSLQKEYYFLQTKYKLQPISVKHWKFLRLRPVNFPTVRIAQFASLIYQSDSLFSKMMEIKNSKEFYPLLQNVSASEYWDTHFQFDENSNIISKKHLGKEAINNILINTVASMQYFYAIQNGKDDLYENSLQLLSTIKPEKNKIINLWKAINIEPNDAAQSQGLLQLYHNYCLNKNCLNCTVAHYLLRN